MMPVRAFGGDHSHAVVKPDAGHKFLAPCNKKTLYFDGLKPTAFQEHALTNPWRHQNDLPLWK